MTDSELMKLAARAAPGIADGDVLYDMERESVWNPLNDDGDALRLRNRINAQLVDEGNFIFVGVYRYGIAAIEIREPYERDMQGGGASGGSVDAATRRAIVRAAAAIGEAMP